MHSMISGIKGMLMGVEYGFVDINVHGITYRILVSQATARQLGGQDALGQEVALAISLQVRESSMTLYGFYGFTERDAFHSLLNVDGIGPSIAMIVLAAYSVQRLSEIIQEQSIKALTAIVGIGKAKALKLLKDLTL